MVTNDIEAINGDFQRFLRRELSVVSGRARRAEQAVYGRVVDQVMRLVAADLPPLRWAAKLGPGVEFGIEGAVDHTRLDMARRYQVLRQWTYRYGCGHAEIRYRETIEVRARLNVRGVRCVVQARVWRPADGCPRPSLRAVRELASPRPPVPSVAELIARYRQARMPEPIADFLVAELRELSAEIEERRGELTEKERRDWREFVAAHPAPPQRD